MHTEKYNQQLPLLAPNLEPGGKAAGTVAGTLRRSAGNGGSEQQTKMATLVTELPWLAFPAEVDSLTVSGTDETCSVMLTLGSGSVDAGLTIYESTLYFGEDGLAEIYGVGDLLDDFLDDAPQVLKVYVDGSMEGACLVMPCRGIDVGARATDFCKNNFLTLAREKVTDGSETELLAWAEVTEEEPAADATGTGTNLGAELRGTEPGNGDDDEDGDDPLVPVVAPELTVCKVVDGAFVKTTEVLAAGDPVTYSLDGKSVSLYAVEVDFGGAEIGGVEGLVSVTVTVGERQMRYRVAEGSHVAVSLGFRNAFGMDDVVTFQRVDEKHTATRTAARVRGVLRTLSVVDETSYEGKTGVLAEGQKEHFHDFCNALLVWRKSDGAAVTITDADFAPSNDAYAAQYGAATWRVAGRMLRRGVVKVRVFDGSFDESFG